MLDLFAELSELQFSSGWRLGWPCLRVGWPSMHVWYMEDDKDKCLLLCASFLASHPFAAVFFLQLGLDFRGDSCSSHLWLGPLWM